MTNSFYKDVVIFYLVLIVIEIGWSLYAKKDAYDLKETLCSITIAIIQRIMVSLGLGGVIISFFYENALFVFPYGNWQFIAILIVGDFVYYLQHRLHHISPFLWSLHQVHHSSRKLNLVAANRQSWLDYPITLLVFSPLAFIGFHPYFVVFSIYATLFIQWYAHTTAIGKIPLIEGIIITPSAHRVHHSRDSKDYNYNYGSIFMIWDRLFGTYKEEEKKITEFGINGFKYTNNPFKLTFQGPYDYFKYRFKQIKELIKK